MEKDLANAKTLASLLEDEAAKLRRTRVETVEVPKPEGEDAPMEDNQDNEDGDEEEPPERGSDAVDRRVEKVMADMRDQGLVDLSDETAYEIKKVRCAHCCVYL
jgi:hypothetical protein